MSAGRILVVDDSAVNRMLLGSMLEAAEYEVRVACDGRDALRVIETAIPDLVLLDIQMPEMSGYEVCAALKADPRFGTIPVVFISALDDVTDRLKGFEVGGVDYVTKPFEPPEVLARVGAQVKVFQLQRELRRRNAELQRRNEQLVLAQQRTESVFLALAETLPGTVLDDTYRLDHKIGEGGFGAVYRGTHLRLNRPVAIKVLRPANAMNAREELARFRREGIAACRIAHPNAVEVLDFAVTPTGIAYLVMELLRGSTLASLLIESPRLPIARCAELVAPVCDVLAVAHAAGIVHRDIKPHNIFLHRANGVEVVKVLDFGIAKLLDQPPELGDFMTQQGGLVGTPEYMAPERLLGTPVDARSDVYSVGVLLYLLLSGETPFGHTNPPGMAEMVKAHLSAKPRPLGEVAEVPRGVGEMVMRALAQEPGERPGLGEIATALRVVGG